MVVAGLCTCLPAPLPVSWQHLQQLLKAVQGLFNFAKLKVRSAWSRGSSQSWSKPRLGACSNRGLAVSGRYPGGTENLLASFHLAPAQALLCVVQGRRCSLFELQTELRSVPKCVTAPTVVWGNWTGLCVPLVASFNRHNAIHLSCV